MSREEILDIASYVAIKCYWPDCYFRSGIAKYSVLNVGYSREAQCSKLNL